jgi:hypothetical protein
MTQGEAWIAHAVLYVEKYGFSVIPMGSDKKPLIKWAEFQDRRPTFDELLSWKKENLAIVTGSISRLVVVDCESYEDAKWFWDNRGKTSTIVQSRRGFHLYFRHPGTEVRNAQKVENRYDVRGDGGYVLAPPSLHSEGAYSWKKPLVDPSKLPVFVDSWRPPTRNFEADDKQITNAVAYISKIRAISGQGGHDDTFRAAKILREAGLSEAEGLLALQSWNKTNAEPPWSDRELLHKIRQAYA